MTLFWVVLIGFLVVLAATFAFGYRKGWVYRDPNGGHRTYLGPPRPPGTPRRRS